MQISFFVEEEYDKLGISENILKNISFENINKFVSMIYKDKLYDLKDLSFDKNLQIAFIKKVRDRDVIFMDLYKEEIIKEGLAVLVSLKIRSDFFINLLSVQEKNSLLYKKIIYVIYNILNEKEKVENKIKEAFSIKKDEEFDKVSGYFISNLSMCEKWGVCIHDYALIEPYNEGCLNLDGGDLISILPTREEWKKEN